MFYYKISWFYEDVKSQNLRFLNMYSVHVARMLDLVPPNEKPNTFTTLKTFPSCQNWYNISIF